MKKLGKRRPAPSALSSVLREAAADLERQGFIDKATRGKLDTLAHPVGKRRKRNSLYPKGIARIDQASKKTHGWYVRIRLHGEIHAKFFSDKKLGDRNGSLAAAIAWRNKTESRLGIPRTEKRLVTVSSAGTGMVGVRMKKDGKAYEVTWVGSGGKQGKTSVAISKHGKEKERLRIE